MKKRYFIPLSSLNLNGVFASESISPHSFYEKRMFGVPYNTLTDNNGIYLQTESSLALYPEYFEFIPTVGSAVFIGVYEDDLDLSALVNDIETGISYYFKTIYLRKGNFFVLFLGDDEKMLFLATAAPSTEVKTLNKYNKKHHFGNDRETDIFYSIPDFPKKAYNRNLANLLSNNKAVYFDKAFNHIKGFVYGYLCGALGQKNEDEIELENTFQELHNLITGIKGKIEITQLFSPNDFDEFKKELDKSSSLFMRLVPNEKNFNYENILLRLQELINLQEKRFAKLTRQKRHFDGIDRGEVKAIQKQIEELEKSFYSIRGKEQDLRDKKKWFEENKPKRTKANTSERIEKVRIDREIEDIKVNIKNLKPEKQDLQQQISYLRNDLQQPTAIGRTEFDNSVDEQYYRIAAYITDLSFSVSERINEKKKTLSWPKIDQLIFDIKKLTQHWAKIASNNFDFIISFNSTYIQQLSQICCLSV